MFQIKPEDLLAIVIAAKQHYLRLQELYDKGESPITYQEEISLVLELRRFLIKTHWDEDAMLMIDEMPF